MDTLTLFYHDRPGCTAVFFTIPTDGYCPACAGEDPENWVAFQLLAPDEDDDEE